MKEEWKRMRCPKERERSTVINVGEVTKVLSIIGWNYVRKKIHRPLSIYTPLYHCWCGRGSLVISRNRGSLVVSLTPHNFSSSSSLLNRSDAQPLLTTTQSSLFRWNLKVRTAVVGWDPRVKTAASLLVRCCERRRGGEKGWRSWERWWWNRRWERGWWLWVFWIGRRRCF